MRLTLLALFVHVALIVAAIFVHFLAALEQEGLLVEDEVVEDAGEEDTFKHDQVADDLACQEGILKLLVLDEVVEPLLPKPGHSGHLEEVAGLKTRHVTTSSRRGFCEISDLWTGSLGAPAERCRTVVNSRASRLLTVCHIG